MRLIFKSKNRVNSSGTGHSSDDEESNSGDSDASRTANHSRSNVNRQNSLQPQISQDFLSSSGNNHDLHNTSISIEQQSRHSFPASISSGVSIISSLGMFILYNFFLLKYITNEKSILS